MKKVKEMVNCEVKEAKKAVKEARETYNESIRACNKVMCSIDFSNHLPDEVYKELVEDLLKKLPKNISKEKLGYEIVCAVWCAVWRAVCATDIRCIAASKAIQDDREVLSKLQIKSKPAF